MLLLKFDCCEVFDTHTSTLSPKPNSFLLASDIRRRKAYHTRGFHLLICFIARFIAIEFFLSMDCNSIEEEEIVFVLDAYRN